MKTYQGSRPLPTELTTVAKTELLVAVHDFGVSDQLKLV